MCVHPDAQRSNPTACSVVKKMVSFSLYRGNMHRVPDAPRRWLMPDQNIPFKSFKALHNRRLKALSRLKSNIATTSLNPNPNLGESGEIKAEEGELRGGEGKEGGGVDRSESEVVVVKEEVQEADFEMNEKVPESSDNEKRKKEAEEKLQALNSKKHGLVQLLKQILNAEEEMKRRSLMQASANRPMPALHVDVQNDSDPISRHATPRTGSETNHGAEMEGVEMSNHVSHARPLSRMSSMSPCSESPNKRFGYFHHNTVPQPSRSVFGAASPSPSRFAPTPPQVHPASFPPISVCTTNYVASLPSPAASGGTPGFRDTRHPSPWS